MRPIDGDSGKFSVTCFGRSCDGAAIQITIGQLKPVVFLILGGKQPHDSREEEHGGVIWQDAPPDEHRAESGPLGGEDDIAS